MNFKIDENLPLEFVDLLREAGHDAVTVLDQQLGGADDSTVAARCRQEHRALITLDLDFSDIREYPPEDHHGLIVLRVHRQDKLALIRVFRQAIGLLASEPLSGRLWIVEETKIPDTRSRLTCVAAPMRGCVDNAGDSDNLGSGEMATMITTADAVELQERVRELKKLKNAVILAHNYQVPELQDVADFVGDSLGLSFKAKETDADVILFCGVHFMAETAKIVNPGKTVILPDLDAGCSLADSCDAKALAKWREAHPDVTIVAYINCTAAVKALVDIICTSGNAVKVVNSIPPDKKILFVPDQNLGQWVMAQTGRQMILWPGACSTHVLFTHKAIFRLRQEHPEAEIVAHPECLPAVRMMADEVCSTEKMVSYCKNSPAPEFIIVTEAGMLHRLQKEVPNKVFIPGPTDSCHCNECSFMKKNTLEKAVAALETLSPEIILDEDVRKRALVPIERMLALGK